VEQVLAIHHGKDLITTSVPILPCFALLQGYNTG